MRSGCGFVSAHLCVRGLGGIRGGLLGAFLGTRPAGGKFGTGRQDNLDRLQRRHQMRGSNLGGQRPRGVLLADGHQRRNDAGGVGRVHLCQIKIPDDAMRQKNGLGNTAGSGRLLKCPQHQRRD